MTHTICTGTAALALLLAAYGPLSAQEPAGAGQPPQSSSSPSDDQRRDGPGWWDWQQRMMGEGWGQGVGGSGRWGPGGMMGWQGRGPGMMWGGGLPMHSGMMPMMMIAVMVTDGNGSISYEEVEAVHRRMFNLLDKDKSGELSPEEMQDVMGWRFERDDDDDRDDNDN